MRFDIALDIAGKVADTGAALGAQHRLAIRDELDPRRAVDPIFFTVRDVDLESDTRRIGGKTVGDLPLLQRMRTDPHRQFARAIADVDRPFREWLDLTARQRLRDVTRQHGLAMDARQLLR